jgi:hypothetical protein
MYKYTVISFRLTNALAYDMESDEQGLYGVSRQVCPGVNR